MPFPPDSESLLAAGYKFLRSETCSQCREMIEIFSTPGGREIVMDPMGLELSPAVPHWKTCGVQYCTNGNEGSAEAGQSKPSQPVQQGQEGAKESTQGAFKMYAVNDPNHQLLAVGYEPVDGILRCRFPKAYYDYRGVPEDKFESLKKVPYAYSYFTKTIKGKFPATKVEA